MIVLGLGSNLGDRLNYLVQTIERLDRADGIFTINAASPVYESDALLLPESPPDWNIPFYNLAISGTSSLAPGELLRELKALEDAIGRKPHARWAPREIDIDILAWDDATLEQTELKIPHLGLLERPFALWPLSDLAPHWRHPSSNEKALNLAQRWGTRIGHTLAPCGTRRAQKIVQHEFRKHLTEIGHVMEDGSLLGAKLVGVINITPDSFSDGGNYNSPNTAFKQITKLVSAGAAVIDLGAESTRPGAAPTTYQEEWSRLEPVLKGLPGMLASLPLRPKISLDTRRPEIIRSAAHYEFDWLNDVTGLQNIELANLAAAHKFEIVVMHSLGIPPSKDRILPLDRDPLQSMREWAERRINELEEIGISRARLIVDPGIGFGKSAEQSWAILSGIEKLTESDVRVLVGHSRKSFLSLITDRPFADRDLESAQLSALLAEGGVKYLRVHDVEASRRAINTRAALLGYLPINQEFSI